MANRRRRDPRASEKPSPESSTSSPAEPFFPQEDTGEDERVDPISVAYAALNAPPPEEHEAPIVNLLRRFTTPRASTAPGPTQPATLETSPGAAHRSEQSDEVLDPLSITRDALAAEAEREERAALEALEPSEPKRRFRSRARPDQSPGETSPASEPEDALFSLPAETETAEEQPFFPEVEPEQPEQPDQSEQSELQGWVFHRLDENGFQGWLYHYADGDTVKEDGSSYVPGALVAETAVQASSADASATGGHPGSEPVRSEAAPSEERFTAPPISAADGGWMFHAMDETGFDGWLYHHSDGTLVTEDGHRHDPAAPVLPEPRDVADLVPEPHPDVADVTPEPAETSRIRALAEPTEAETARPAESAEPRDARSAALGSLISAMTARPSSVETEVAELVPAVPDAVAPDPVESEAIEPDQVAEALGVTNPTDDVDEGWVFHAMDASGFEGWLYHYADGSMLREDGTAFEYDAPNEPRSTPASEVDALVVDGDSEAEADASDAPTEAEAASNLLAMAPIPSGTRSRKTGRLAALFGGRSKETVPDTIETESPASAEVIPEPSEELAPAAPAPEDIWNAEGATPTEPAEEEPIEAAEFVDESVDESMDEPGTDLAEQAEHVQSDDEQVDDQPEVSEDSVEAPEDIWDAEGATPTEPAEEEPIEVAELVDESVDEPGTDLAEQAEHVQSDDEQVDDQPDCVRTPSKRLRTSGTPKA